MRNLVVVIWEGEMETKKIRKTLLYMLLVFVVNITITRVTRAKETAIIAVEPEDITIGVGQTFDVNITITHVENLYMWSLNFTWDPAILNLTNYTEGPFLQTGGDTIFVPVAVNYTTGMLSGLICSLWGKVPGVSGNGTLATLTFRAIAMGTSIIDVSGEDRVWSGLLDSDGNFIPYDDQDGRVTVVSEKRLAIKVSGELDYMYWEKIDVKIAALVSDANTMEPISDADVTIKIYDPDGNLWSSDRMIERPKGTGIYQWEINKTVAEAHKKGIYLAHIQASFKGGPTVSDIVEFHIDPLYYEKDYQEKDPVHYEKKFQPRIVIGGTLLLLIATGITAAVLMMKKEKS